MNILITGINGFIGSNLAKKLLEDHSVIGIVRDVNTKSKMLPKESTIIHGDITDLELLKRVITQYEIDIVFHLAASSIVRISASNPYETYKTNIIGTLNILEAIRYSGRKIKCIIASSDKAYGITHSLPYHEDDKLRPNDIYSSSKAASDIMILGYIQQFNLDVCITRLANVYGGGDLNLSRIFPKSILRMIHGNNPQIYNDVLDYVREFIYIDDAVSAYIFLSKNGKPGNIYNVGSNNHMKVRDAINYIISKYFPKRTIDIIEKKYSFNEIPRQTLDITKINELGWKPKYNFKIGIHDTIEWYKKNSNLID